MRFIFSTGSLWTYSIERCFAFAAEAGFDGIELMVDTRWETRQAAYLRPLIERYGLPIVAVHSPFSSFVPGWPYNDPGRIGESIRLAEALGAGVVVHHLPSRVGYVWVQAGPRFFPLPIPGWSRDRPYRRWLETEYPQAQAQTAVTLCIENMPAYGRLGRRWNVHHWNTPEEITRFPSLTMDTTHLGTWGLEPAEIYARWQGRVRHIHLSNFDKKEHLRPETGKLRLDVLLQRLAAGRYDGAISLELHPEALDAGQPDAHVIGRMRASLEHCRAWAGK